MTSRQTSLFTSEVRRPGRDRRSLQSSSETMLTVPAFMSHRRLPVVIRAR